MQIAGDPFQPLVGEDESWLFIGFFFFSDWNLFVFITYYFAFGDD